MTDLKTLKADCGNVTYRAIFKGTDEPLTITPLAVFSDEGHLAFWHYEKECIGIITAKNIECVDPIGPCTVSPGLGEGPGADVPGQA